MTLQVSCPHCRKQLKAPDHLRGVAVKCPSCRAPIPWGPPADDPYLSDLLSAVAESNQAPAMPRASSSSPFGSVPRPAGRHLPAWKQGGAAGFLRTNSWTVVTLLSSIPFIVMFGTILVVIPWLFIAALVFISEYGRRHNSADGVLSQIDRMILSVFVGLNLTTAALVAIVGIVKGAQQPEPGVAIAVALGVALVMAVSNLPGLLVAYFLARAFGLGRSHATLSVLFALCGIIMLIALPQGFARQPVAAAINAGNGAGGANGGAVGPIANPGVQAAPPNGPQANIGNAPPSVPQQGPGGPGFGTRRPTQRTWRRTFRSRPRSRRAKSRRINASSSNTKLPTPNRRWIRPLATRRPFPRPHGGKGWAVT